MKYRPEIDGLRAVAVIPVILFHAGFRRFAGGFVGVDVFFVISGHLITSLILTDLQAGQFSMARFYERRARRILPPLFVMMAVCLPLAWWWLLPDDTKYFARSLVAVPLFISNIAFWREGGYFDPAMVQKPLFHTWSLGVEEQFYVLFPLFLLFAWRLRRWLVWLLAAVALVSLALAEWGVLGHSRNAAFYLLPTRGWELLIGAMAASYVNHVRPSSMPTVTVLDQGASAVGLALIALAVFGFDESTPFPGLAALIPTLGAVLILLFAHPGSRVGRALSSRPLVGLGLISYGAYLWHQPLFVFARDRSIVPLGTAADVALIGLTVVLAYLSWRYVETPFRRRGSVPRRAVVLVAVVASAAFIAIGVLAQREEGFPGRLPPNIEWSALGYRIARTGPVCRTHEVPGRPGIAACYFGAQKSNRVVALYGDSHAQALSYELNAAFTQNGVKGVIVGTNDCGAIPHLFDKLLAAPEVIRRCDREFNELIAFLQQEVSAVVVAARWTYHLYPIAGVIDELAFRNSEGGQEIETEHQFVALRTDGTLGTGSVEKKQAVDHLITRLLTTRKPIVLVYPIPEVGWNIAQVNWLFYRAHHHVLPNLSIPVEDAVERNRFVTQVFNVYTGTPGLIVVDPARILCDSFIERRCAVQVNGVPFYLDDDHLSDAGARPIVSEIVKRLAATTGGEDAGVSSRMNDIPSTERANTH